MTTFSPSDGLAFTLVLAAILALGALACWMWPGGVL